MGIKRHGGKIYLVAGGHGVVARRSAWTYLDPSPGYEVLWEAVAFYPGRIDECTVDGERVAAQDGDFYGGWIAAEVLGPFRGGPGTHGW